MEIKHEQIMDHNDLLGHMVIEACAKHPDIQSELMDGESAEVFFTINGKKTDPQEFVDRWQSQIKGMIASEAKELIGERFRETRDLLYDLEGRLTEEIDKRLEDWEREG